MPDHTEALKAWLQANGCGDIAEAGLAPLALYMLAARRPGLPPMPAEVLASWSTLLDQAILYGRESAAAFVAEARRADITDDRIRRALQVDGGVDLDEHADQLRADARAYAIRRADMDWRSPTQLPPPQSTDQPRSQCRPPKRISVQMDYSSTPLWMLPGAGQHGGNLRQLDLLPLGAELIGDLQAWADEWHRDDRSGEDRQRWVEQGRQLTDRVQTALGDGYVVTYAYEPREPTDPSTRT